MRQTRAVENQELEQGHQGRRNIAAGEADGKALENTAGQIITTGAGGLGLEL